MAGGDENIGEGCLGRRRRKGGRLQKAKGANTEEKENRKKAELICKPPAPAGAPRRGPRSDLAKSSPQALAPQARRAGVLDLARSAERGKGARIF